MFLFGIEGQLCALMCVSVKFFLDNGLVDGVGVLVWMVPRRLAELLEVDDGAVLSLERVGCEFASLGAEILHCCGGCDVELVYFL